MQVLVKQFIVVDLGYKPACPLLWSGKPWDLDIMNIDHRTAIMDVRVLYCSCLIWVVGIDGHQASAPFDYKDYF